MKGDREDKGVSAVIGNLIMACMIVATGTGVSNMLMPTLEAMDKIENDMYQFMSSYDKINNTRTIYIYNETIKYVSNGDGRTQPQLEWEQNKTTGEYIVFIYYNYTKWEFGFEENRWIEQRQ
jgi:hypothetical protein